LVISSVDQKTPKFQFWNFLGYQYPSYGFYHFLRVMSKNYQADESGEIIQAYAALPLSCSSTGVLQAIIYLEHTKSMLTVQVALEPKSPFLSYGRFILQSGCCMPAHARLENVQAMVAAATEF